MLRMPQILPTGNMADPVMQIINYLLPRIADLCLAGAVLGCLYILVSSLLVLRFGSRRLENRYSPLPLTILMPLCGHEAGLRSRLLRLCNQAYAAPVQILCGAQNPSDPSIEVVRKADADAHDCTIDLHIEPRVNGRNLKVSNLINMAQQARHDVFVMIDSDIEVGQDYLARVVGELQKPGVGAVTCLYHGVAAGGVWARLAAMGINLNFLPNVILALAFDLARPCFGATIAISRDTLKRIGGLPAFADQLWDDYAIGEAVRELGLRVAVPSLIVGHVCTEKSAWELLSNQLRYARTIRSIDPIGYAGGIITHPLALALLAALFGQGQQGVAVAMAALVLRMGQLRCVEICFGAQANSYLLVPLRDLLAFAIYVASFFGARIVWRDQRFRILSDGTLMPDPK